MKMAKMHRSKKQYVSAETWCFARQLVDKRIIYQYSALASIKLHSRGGCGVADTSCLYKIIKISGNKDSRREH
jgi:hypothetical protein